jgi:hypothetical protein
MSNQSNGEMYDLTVDSGGQGRQHESKSKVKTDSRTSEIKVKEITHTHNARTNTQAHEHTFLHALPWMNTLNELRSVREGAHNPMHHCSCVCPCTREPWSAV